MTAPKSQRPIEWDRDLPLDRCTFEPKIAWDALQVYAKMGTFRSVPVMISQFKELRLKGEYAPTTNIATARRWSGLYKWVDRVAAWESQLAREDRKQWELKHKQLWQEDWKDGTDIRNLARVLLMQAPSFITEQVDIIQPANPNDPIIEKHYLKFNPVVMLQMFKLASELQTAAGPSGKDTPAEISIQIPWGDLSEEQLTRIANGENPLRVLGKED